jgi:antitoxin VapB
MAFSVKDPETDAAVRRLSELLRKNLTDTIKEAVTNEFNRRNAEVPLEKRVEPLLAEFDSYPRTGLVADKAFNDELSGNI